MVVATFSICCLMWPSIVDTKYIANPHWILGNIDWMPLAFTQPLLTRTTACTERICCLQHYSQVLAAYITLQTICSLTVSNTWLLRAQSDGVAYQNVKEPRYIIAKNAMSVFILNVLNNITVSIAVCKVHLRKKEVVYKKVIFQFSSLSLSLSLSLSVHNSSNKT